MNVERFPGDNSQPPRQGFMQRVARRLLRGAAVASLITEVNEPVVSKPIFAPNLAPVRATGQDEADIVVLHSHNWTGQDILEMIAEAEARNPHRPQAE